MSLVKAWAYEKLRCFFAQKIHEERMVALLILIEKFKRAHSEVEKGKIVKFYLDNLRWVNNWDLVDLSAPNILGSFLTEKNGMGRKRSLQLLRLARSKSVWMRRVAIVSTLQFIRRNEFEDTLQIAEVLVQDDHDLICKAVGWMLREIGKRDIAVEESFLLKYYQTVPRIMLRYAIEKFPEEKRQRYFRKNKS